MTINIENFLLSLQIMWKGMLGIFVVMILLTLIVTVLTKVQNKK